MQKTEIGIVHGRFQPPHNGHIKYILKALEQSQKIIIGICTPKICTAEEAKISGYHCSIEENPLSFEERATLLRGALSVLNIPETQYSFIDFPSDYKDIEKIIPKNSVFLISRSSTGDDQKIDYLKNLGYETKIILETSETRDESGTNIREIILNKENDWQNFVPENVADFLKKKFNKDL